MPNTITSYHVFQAKTKARASQVNANFSNHRGTLVPIDPNTAAAAGNTYDLGSTEHRWLGAYVNNLDIRGSTSTVNFTISQDLDATAGAVDFKLGSSTIMSIVPAGLLLADMTTAVSSPVNNPPMQANTYSTFLTVTISCSHVHPIEGYVSVINATTTAQFAIEANTTSLQAFIRVYRNTTTSIVFYRAYEFSHFTAGVLAIPGNRMELDNLRFLDNSASSGTNEYVFQYKGPVSSLDIAGVYGVLRTMMY